jgi:hypothetical protein
MTSESPGKSTCEMVWRNERYATRTTRTKKKNVYPEKCKRDKVRAGTNNRKREETIKLQFNLDKNKQRIVYSEKEKNNKKKAIKSWKRFLQERSSASWEDAKKCSSKTTSSVDNKRV